MHPDLAPLAWMIGSWAGAGVVGYPSIESRNFGQEIDVTHDGRPFLMWTSRAWLLDEQGRKVKEAYRRCIRIICIVKNIGEGILNRIGICL